MSKTQSCMNCTYAIFDPLFGEYKCSKKERYCTDDEMWYNDCELYNEGKPSTAKERRDYDDDIKEEL